MKKIIVLIFIFLSSICFAQQGWYFLNPTPDGIDRFGLVMFSESSGMCRGNNSIFKTNDAGKTWREINFNVSDLPFGSFSILDSSIAYAVMGSGKLIKTTDGCESWKFVTQFPYNYNGVSFISKTLGFNIVTDSTRKSKIFRTSDGGLNWHETYSLDSSYLRGCSFLNQSTGYAVGYKYQYNIFPYSYSSKILKTTNGGNSWNTIPSNFGDILSGTKFINKNTGFLFAWYNSSGLFMRTTNGGITWGDSVRRNVRDMRFFDDNSGYAIFDNNLLGKTTNAGKNWTTTAIANPTINYDTYPNSIYFFNQTTGISVGTIGLNLKTTNAGNSWVNYNSAQLTDEIDDIIFKNDNTGFAMGWSKNIFKTTNSGVNWTKYTLGVSNTEFGAMAYAGGSTWYLTDYFNPTLLKTTNDGLNWTSSNPGFSGITDMQFINENTGFGVCKYSRFVKTTNGGINWFKNDSLRSGQNWTVNFIDEYTGYVGGGNHLRKTTNGGISFDTISRTYLDYVWDVKFLSRDTIIASGTTHDYTSGYYLNKGTVWKSTNAGITWIPKLYSVSNYLNGPLRFPNSKTGYVYDGQEYMYKTTNGGDNWFQIKAPEGNYYAMSFLNAETGYMGGYKGQIAKTTDGGMSMFVNTNESIQKSFSLYQNYPNPFNPSTKIKFDLPKNENVKIIIFDILGRKLETLLDENLTTGVHEVNWNASKYAAGVYFYMLLTDGIKETKKMILIK